MIVLETKTKENLTKSSDAIDKLKVLLIDSLKIRLRSDVPLAGFLSGGIDSTLVCSLIKDHFNKDLKTICVSFDSELLDGVNTLVSLRS